MSTALSAPERMQASAHAEKVTIVIPPWIDVAVIWPSVLSRQTHHPDVIFAALALAPTPCAMNSKRKRGAQCREVLKFLQGHFGQMLLLFGISMTVAYRIASNCMLCAVHRFNRLTRSQRRRPVRYATR